MEGRNERKNEGKKKGRKRREDKFSIVFLTYQNRI